jgi:hypothetical protein
MQRQSESAPLWRDLLLWYPDFLHWGLPLTTSVPSMNDLMQVENLEVTFYSVPPSHPSWL